MDVIGFQSFIEAKKKYIKKTAIFYYISIFHFMFVFIFCGHVLLFSFVFSLSSILYIYILFTSVIDRQHCVEKKKKKHRKKKKIYDIGYLGFNIYYDFFLQIFYEIISN
jgi:hypothetical protein